MGVKVDQDTLWVAFECYLLGQQDNSMVLYVVVTPK